MSDCVLGCQARCTQGHDDCPGHPHRADHGYVCAPCLKRLTGRLTEIPALYASLDARPVVGGHTEGKPKGFGSRSPASDHVITMTDRRSKPREVASDGTEYVWDPQADHGLRLPDGVEGPALPPGAYVAKRDVWYGSDGKSYREDPRPPLSTLGTLAGWVAIVREERPLAPADHQPSVHSEADVLLTHLDWIVHCGWVDEFAADVAVLYAQVKAASGDPAPRPIAWCIEQRPRGECGTPLFEQPGVVELDCGKCGRHYAGPGLLLLRIANEERKAS